MRSVIIPVRNERGNVEELLRRVRQAVPEAEVVIVDDSDDGTEEVLASLAGPEVRVIHREGAERDGLSGAVLEGMRRARGDVLAVLDADLQHPPEILPRLFAAVESGADVAAASRYAPGGGRTGSRRGGGSSRGWAAGWRG